MEQEIIKIIVKALYKEDLSIINDNKYLNDIAELLNDKIVFPYKLFVKIVDTNKNLTEIILKNEQSKNNYMLGACLYNNFNIIKLLIEHGIDIHYNHEYPLYSMISNKQYEHALYLIENGADINVIYHKNKHEFIKYQRKVKLSKINNE